MSITDLMASPTYRSTRGRVPVYRPLLNGQEFDITVKEAAVILGDNTHETAVLSCSSSTLTNLDGILDSTLSFFFGQAPRTELFCGYITSVSEEDAGKGNLTFSLMVLGATQPMLKGRPRFWRNKTVPAAVESLSYANGLGFHGSSHTHLWGVLAQTSESDWQMAVQYTKRLGWSLFTRYGVLMCMDPNELISTKGAYVTLCSIEKLGDYDITEERRLIEFTPSEKSEEIPENMGTQVAYFSDKGDVQVIKEIGDFKSYRFVNNVVLRNRDEAEIIANAGASRVSEWKQKAEARIWGDADIYPGMCVDVVTANRAYYREKFDGRWLVQSVGHKMDGQQYQTNLRLARPASDTQITQDVYRSFWLEAGRSRPTLSIQDKAWVSSWTNPTLRDVA